MRFDGIGGVLPVNVGVALQTQRDYSAFPLYSNGNLQIPAAADGSFTIPGVSQGDYRVAVTLPSAGPRGGSDSLYVADIRLGGVSLYDSGISVEGVPLPPMEIIVKADGGAVEGTAYRADRVPAGGVTVVLAPAMQRRQNPALYRSVSADPTGRFRIGGLAPGDYKLFSWEDLIPNAYQSATFIQEFETRGQSITVRSLATATAEVSVIPRSNSVR